MNSSVWDHVMPFLALRFRVHCVDLPGHGYSKPLDAVECTLQKGELAFESQHGLEMLDALVQTLSAQFNGPLNLCGWSIGGLAALRWAQRVPQQVQRLVLVASSPCFMRREDWLFGMAASTLQKFSEELERDHIAMLRRFITLLVSGSTRQRESLVYLRERLFSRGEPDLNALRAGLEILRSVDMRAELPTILQPALLIAGALDQVSAPGATQYMAQVLPHARAVLLAGAAHTPFLSHPEIFLEEITDFLHERI
jgi:pimeloyl-[acyl-carrier protein] methyl ester esterase